MDNKTAFIIARASMLRARIEAMVAANEDYRVRTGSGVAYGEDQFQSVINDFPDLEYDALMGYLEGLV